MKLISKSPGTYTYQAPDGTLFGVNLSEDRTGPKGGLEKLWEVVTVNARNEWEISNDFAPELRLKDCRDALRAHVAANHQTQTRKEPTRQPSEL